MSADQPTSKRAHVGQYELGRTLGQGTFGKVKLGTDIFTGEKVAIKIIANSSVRTPKELHSLERERNILLKLNHPNIVKLLKVVDDPTRNTCYMIFEYVNGGELFDFILNHGRLAEPDARKFMRQIISAVEYCHSLLVIHRDLKPENLLLDDKCNIKITDFGLSNVMEPGKRFNTFCGSLHYAAPEILRGRAYLGPGIDVWAMGIILYCLVVGRQPWDGGNAQEMMHTILNDGLEIPDHISESCVDLILQMLRVKEEDRIKVPDMRRHPWINQGYDHPPPSHLPPMSPITEIDDSIIEKLQAMGFITADNLESVYSSLRSGDPENQINCVYHLLAQQSNEKKKPPVQPQPQQPPQQTKKSSDSDARRIRSVSLSGGHVRKRGSRDKESPPSQSPTDSPEISPESSPRETKKKSLRISDKANKNKEEKQQVPASEKPQTQTLEKTSKEEKVVDAEEQRRRSEERSKPIDSPSRGKSPLRKRIVVSSPKTTVLELPNEASFSPSGSPREASVSPRTAEKERQRKKSAGSPRSNLKSSFPWMELRSRDRSESAPARKLASSSPEPTARIEKTPPRPQRPVLNIDDISSGKITNSSPNSQGAQPAKPSPRKLSSSMRPNVHNIFSQPPEQPIETQFSLETDGDKKQTPAPPPMVLRPKGKSNESLKNLLITNLSSSKTQAEIERVLKKLEIPFKKKGVSFFKCSLMVNDLRVVFTIEIVKDAGQKQVRLTRIEGSSFSYQSLCTKFVAEIKLN